jgi:hypothetical protein
MVEWKTLDLPLPNTSVSHTLFYKASSALEVEVFNLPLAETPEDQIGLLTNVFSLFGHVDSVTVSKHATVKFESTKGIERAMAGRRKHSRDLPLAVAGTFGIEYFIAKYQKVHPPMDVLERVSSEYIREFEAKEKERRGKHVVQMTEAETHEVMRKYHEKVKKMQSTDFYAFQQKDRPSLVSELLSDEGPAPRHLKKKPKPKQKAKGKGNADGEAEEGAAS